MQRILLDGAFLQTRLHYNHFKNDNPGPVVAPVPSQYHRMPVKLLGEWRYHQPSGTVSIGKHQV
ncbi:MAG: hypothetical protein QXH42_05220 [Thermoplasmata archaeon]